MDALIFDKNGDLAGFEGDDAELLSRSYHLLDSLKAWREDGSLPDDADVACIDEMLELVELLTNVKHTASQINQAIEHLEIWCNVMRSALPFVIGEEEEVS